MKKTKLNQVTMPC